MDAGSDAISTVGGRRICVEGWAGFGVSKHRIPGFRVAVWGFEWFVCGSR